MIWYEYRLLRHLPYLKYIKDVKCPWFINKLTDWDRSWKFLTELASIKFLHVMIYDLLSSILPLNHKFWEISHIHTRVVCAEQWKQDQSDVYENWNYGIELFLGKHFFIEFTLNCWPKLLSGNICDTRKEKAVVWIEIWYGFCFIFSIALREEYKGNQSWDQLVSRFCLTSSIQCLFFWFIFHYKFWVELCPPFIKKWLVISQQFLTAK